MFFKCILCLVKASRAALQETNFLASSLQFIYRDRYSKTCVKRSLKNTQNKDLNDKFGGLMKVKSIAECSPWSILQYF